MESRSRQGSSKGLLVSTSLTSAAVYAVLTAVVSMVLSFPGFGVVLLPQPFLRVAVLGKTVSYELADVYTIAWALYVVAVHLALYSALWGALGLSRPYVYVAVAIYLLNLVLVLAGLSDANLVHYVRTYTLGYAGFLPGLGLTVAIEWLGFRASGRLRGRHVGG